MIHNWMEWSVSEKSGTLERRQSVAKKQEREENATQAKGKTWRKSKKEWYRPRKQRAKRGEKARKKPRMARIRCGEKNSFLTQ